MKFQNTALKRIKAVSFICSAAIALLAPTAANAASLKVLWHGHSDAYNTKMSELADKASTYDPEGDGILDWDLTIWNPQDPTPDFSDYDVFAIGSGGGEISPILNNKDAIAAARGSRTFLTGQDPDNHYVNNRPGPRPDGPLGFLVNAINWAGSGEGMGIVSLADYEQWWLNENSFLKDELEGYVSFFFEDRVVIPTATSDFPVNEGLTTAGLSNWGISAHAGFNKNIPGYLSINDAGSHPGYAVTIVTASEADGSTLGPLLTKIVEEDEKETVPEPSSILGLFVLGGLGVRSLWKRQKL